MKAFNHKSIESWLEHEYLTPAGEGMYVITSDVGFFCCECEAELGYETLVYPDGELVVYICPHCDNTGCFNDWE